MTGDNDQEYIVQLDKYAYGGESIGRLEDGRAVFVPFALPGETARIRLIVDKPRFARAELLEIIQPVASRVTPKCVHYGECGGCHYQHLDYGDQLVIKQTILRDQLQRIGKFENPEVEPTVPSPLPWNYRNHVQFHLNSGGELGYIGTKSQGILPLRECHLPGTPLNDLWSQLEFGPDSGLDRVSLRLGLDDELMMLLHSQDPQPIEFQTDLSVSVIYEGPGGQIILSGEDYILVQIFDFTFRVSAGSFFQVNSKMAESLVQHILENIVITKDSVVVDAYCGVGLFSAFIAPKVRQLIGIEGSPSSAADFETNLDEFENVSLYEAKVEDVLPQLEEHPDVIILDPPRSGLDRSALDAIVSLASGQLIYISCDPATMARDSRRLAVGGYQLVKITPFDLFPQTYHIESVSIWKKN